jgi:hypothetical protein
MNRGVSVEVRYKDFDFIVKGSWVEYVPGRYSGPPERCYPSEGGYIEEEDIFIGSKSVISILNKNTIDAIVEKAEDACLEKYGG